LSVLLVLCDATRNPLAVTRDGNLLRTHRLRIRFVDIPADTFDVAGLSRPAG
jgi:hypothetical protein